MYSATHQFEPLLPASRDEGLRAQAARLADASIRLSGCAHETSRSAIRQLVRSMNSYYSNQIEGHGTHPRNIERALRQDFSAQPDVARLQRIALAHIDAEIELEQHCAGGPAALNSRFLLACHAALYSRLPEADRRTGDGHVVAPGQLRQEPVAVGLHVAPVAPSLPRFLARMDEVYGHSNEREQLLIDTACLHHRAAWVHPFRDGNGRATRLQSHCALLPLSQGLWSPSRGLARARLEYYARLQNADAPRRGDLDGRGNLTAAGLAEWAGFFLGVCEDQAAFMAGMLALDGMKQRIAALIAFRAAQDKAYRPQAILPLYHAFAAGPLTRREFSQMTGLGERTARSLLARLLSAGLLASDTPLGPVRFALPLDALQFLIPNLYPEVDQAFPPA